MAAKAAEYDGSQLSQLASEMSSRYTTLTTHKLTHLRLKATGDYRTASMVLQEFVSDSEEAVVCLLEGELWVSRYFRCQQLTYASV